eukprot:TRINITY_DN82947_c0_g1_i1.p1 TRINITY_DN82947_c0_g1~~TRINITY_DN82947_c0_g1_i1.p1  ORF type:complete len:271 (-),score=91.35 TRINITY_DN82947_c0_g1_i1:147-959(-)
MAAKRQKIGLKNFDDYTVADFKELIKTVGKLEAQLEAKDEEADEVAEKRKNQEHKQARKADNSIKDAAEKVKQCIFKSIMDRMTPDKELSEKEQTKLAGKDGREISVFIPNVSMDVLAALGLDKGSGCIVEQKSIDNFLPRRPSKTLTTGGLVQTQWWISFRYVKTSSELRVTTNYNWLSKPRPRYQKRTAKDAGLSTTEAEGSCQEEGNETAAEDAAATPAGEEVAEPEKKGKSPAKKSPAKKLEFASPARSAAAIPVATDEDDAEDVA